MPRTRWVQENVGGGEGSVLGSVIREREEAEMSLHAFSKSQKSGYFLKFNEKFVNIKKV